MGRVNDPNYCKSHQVVSHPVKKCFVLMKLIMKLALDKKIELDIDDVTQTNHAAVTIHLDGRIPTTKSLIQFESLEPISIYSSSKALQNDDLQTIGFKEDEKQV